MYLVYNNNFMTKCLISIILIDIFNQIICSSSQKFFTQSSALRAAATQRLLSKPSQSIKNGTSTNLIRKKRGVLELAEMIECVTKCDPFSYLEYGCFCGYSGFGFPIDPIDDCCYQHDWCYHLSSCPRSIHYFMPYKWNCYKPGYAHCDANLDLPDCSYQLCECDRRFAECLKKFRCPVHKHECPYDNSIVDIIFKLTK